MIYSQFTLNEAIETFEIEDNPELYPVLFQNIESIEPFPHLQEVLKQNKNHSCNKCKSKERKYYYSFISGISSNE